MRVPLILVFLFVASAAAVFSCYRATPNLYIQPPTFNSKLLLDELITCIDATAGTFYINSTEYYADTGGAHQLPFVLLYGNVSFAAPQLIQFSYPNNSELYCAQARSSPPLCPLLQTYTNGPFVFSAAPSLATPQVLTIEASSTFYDPLTGAPYNFFYAPQPISLVCTSGSCASLANVVPPSPLPPDPVFTVRFLLGSRSRSRETMQEMEHRV